LSVSQPNCHWLSQSFAPALAKLSGTDVAQPTKILSQAVSASDFSDPTPPTSNDSSTGSQARQLELALAHHIGQPAQAGPSSPPSPDREDQLRAKGGIELAERTGGRAKLGSLALQLLKARLSADEARRQRRWSGEPDSIASHSKHAVLCDTDRILMEGNLLASLLIGK